MSPSALVLAAALLPCAVLAAEPPKKAPAEKPEAASDRIQTIFWKVYEASEDPEFALLAEPKGYRKLSRDPLIEYTAKWREIGYDCKAMKLTEGHTPAAATFCLEVPVVALGSAMDGFTDDLVAGIVGHELVHLLMRHSAQSEKFFKKDLQKMFGDWMVWRGGLHYRAELGARLKQEFPADTPEQLVQKRENMVFEKFIADTPEAKIFDRELELEADFLGVHLAKLAGYDSKALGKQMQLLADSGVFHARTGDHYDPDIRAKELAWLHEGDYEQKLLSATMPEKKK